MAGKQNKADFEVKTISLALYRIDLIVTYICHYMKLFVENGFGIFISRQFFDLLSVNMFRAIPFSS